jgi:hypothetical protein
MLSYFKISVKICELYATVPYVAVYHCHVYKTKHFLFIAFIYNSDINFEAYFTFICKILCIYYAVCLMKVTQPLPKRVLHSVRSCASSYNFQYPLFSIRSFGSCLNLLNHLPVTVSFLNNVFEKAVPTQDVINSVNLPSFYCL